MKALFTILLISYSIYSYGDIPPLPIKYGKISVEEFNLKICPFDSTADAVVLYETGSVSMYLIREGLGVKYKIHRRIKILNTAGLKYADIEIHYVAEEKTDFISDLQAQTINNDGSNKSVVSKVNSDLIFDVDLDHRFHAKKFTFPDVKVGSILEYSYELISENLVILKKWEFQSSIPTMNSEFITMLPDIFQYTASSTGLIPFTSVTHQNILVDLNMRQIFGGNQSQDEARYFMKDIPGFKVEQFCYNPRSYYSSLSFQLSYVNLPGINYGGYIRDWDDLGKHVMEAHWFGQKIKNYSFIKDIKDQKLFNIEHSIKNINEIYKYVSVNYSFNDNLDFYISDLKKVNENKSGNGTEINTILLCLLREFGYEADPVFIPSRENGEFQKSHPLLLSFDHMIVYVKIDSSYILLDAIDPFRSINLLDFREIGVSGYHINKNHWEWLDINTPPPARIVYNYNIKLNDAGEALGKLELMATSYEGLYAKKEITNNGISKYCQKLLKTEDSDLQIDSAFVSNEDITENKIQLKCNLKFSTNKEGKFIYVNPFIDPELQTNRFKNSTRLLPVEFDYPIAQTSIATIELPDGYSLSEVPKNLKIRLEDNSASYSFIASSSNNILSLKSTITISKLNYLPNEYSELKEFFSNISKIYSQQIVLVKK